MDWFLYDTGLSHERVNTSLLLDVPLKRGARSFYISAMQFSIDPWVSSFSNLQPTLLHKFIYHYFRN